MKKLVISLICVIVVAASIPLIWFDSEMNDTYKFAQSQADLGREYMAGMSELDFEEVAGFATQLMAEADPKAVSQSLSKFSKRPVPPEWEKRGVTFIDYGHDRVLIGWHGGPFAHTNLQIRRDEEGALLFTAHYTDNEPDQLLRTITKKQNKSEMATPRKPSD